ncbi:MAG TPA: hypothetical protein VMB52_04590 [Verrucomicrobiae bacterium]|nr:hypothetical protein [Verrucomicrobiae bacterium]
MKRQGNNVTITPFYQWLLIVVVLASWLFDAILEAHSLGTGYTSIGTWTFQVTLWIFPVSLFVLSLSYTLRPYRTWLQRGFFATLLTVVAMSAYGVLNVVDTLWYEHIYAPGHPLASNASYWQTFGNDWAVMAVTLAAYIVFLVYLSRKRV